MDLVGMALAGAFSVPAGVFLGPLSQGQPWAKAVRGLAASFVVLYGVNLATVAGGPSWGAPQWFLALNLAFAAVAGAGTFGVVLACRLVGRRLGAVGATLVAGSALGFWLAGLYGALLSPGGTVAAVFAAATGWAALAVVAALTILVVGRRSLVGMVPWVLAGAGGALALAVLAVATEVGGSSLPVSPVALVWGAILVYAGVLARWRRSIPPVDRWCQAHSLSAREREVLGLLVAGVPRNDISERLFISPVTVKNHLAALYRKTQTSDLGSLVAAARRAGWPGADHRD